MEILEALKNNGFATADYLVFAAYIVLLVGLGIFLSRGKKGEEKSSSDYFLAGNTLTWWAVGASLIAANISAEQFIGMSGSAFKSGIAMAAYELMAAATLIVVAKFLLPVMIKRKIFTIPQFLSERYNWGVGLAFSIFWLFLYVFINLTSVAWLGALAIKQILGLPATPAVLLGMQVDMNNGTGWPFGGPEVSMQDAACQLVVSEYRVRGGKHVQMSVGVDDAKQKPYAVLERLMAFADGGKCLDLTASVRQGTLTWDAPEGEWRLIAAFCGKTRQKAKRAAPGGEGYVRDHFSAHAVDGYLAQFDEAFAGTAFPHNVFNDSYEVYKADWPQGLFDKFYERRGYKLEEHLPEFLSEERTDAAARIITDYRETLSDLLLENFTRRWTAWAHSHNSSTRNQAHGSPGNLIDLYAAVDVPECEGFGLTDFGIRGLRKDSLTRPNFSDISMLKYASSAAHLTGKPYTSSETFTWLTEHKRPTFLLF